MRTSWFEEDREFVHRKFPKRRFARLDDVVLLVSVIIVTFALKFFPFTHSFVSLLEISRDVWQRLFVWQLLTYAFVGQGFPDIWFVLEIIILYWIASTVKNRIGKYKFRKLIIYSALTGGVLATIISIIMFLLGFSLSYEFALMQGQRTILAILFTAFAAIFYEASVLLFFVIPIKARFFIPVLILILLMGFLRTKDLVGLCGVLAAMAYSFHFFRPKYAFPGFKRLRLLKRRKYTNRGFDKIN